LNRIDEQMLTGLVDYLDGLGIDYGDVRYTCRRSRSLQVRNGAVTEIQDNSDAGVGVRVRVGGAWGFASTSACEPAALRRTADEALAIARASSRCPGPDYGLDQVEPARGAYRTEVEKDPFELPVEEWLNVLLEADRLMVGAQPPRVREGRLAAHKEHKLMASTAGAFTDQELVFTGGGIQATAAESGEVARRSYPNAHRGHFNGGGWEIVEQMDLPGEAERVAAEARQLLDAQTCPAGEMDIVLDGRQLALQVHESCGHPVELDRVFGSEASYAGTSFLTPDKLGKFTYGSEEVNITADATLPRGLGTFGFDDEGVPAARFPVVRQGRFVNYLTSRETAPRLRAELAGEELDPLSAPSIRANGTMRASGWNRMPLVRMTNINLEPGDWSLEELIRDTRRGLYMEINRSWSIDDRRLNFQFGCEAGWLIEDGQLTHLVKRPSYTGLTPQFWRSCDAVCDARHWAPWGTPNCGKGQPGQMAFVGHGTAPARFRGVRVGLV